MSDQEEQLDVLKAEIQEVQHKVARAEYERETAAKARAGALKNLKSMGVASEEAAEAMLDQMRFALREELLTVQTELAKGE